jgi:hypothetical protein
VTQPLDREAMLPQLGEVDSEAGEFWVENPFMMRPNGLNLSAYERNCLFLNINGESFLDASFTSAADIDSDSRSVVAADFDRDGGVDLLVGSDGGGSLRLFLNRVPQRGRSLRIVAQGKQSNRLGIGTRITAKCGRQAIVRDLFPASGFMGQGPAELFVGVGTAERIDELTVRWPTGDTQVFTNVPVDRLITITEGQAEFAAASVGR